MAEIDRTAEPRLTLALPHQILVRELGFNYREAVVFSETIAGTNTKRIADLIGATASSVSVYKATGLHKVRCRNMFQFLAYAMRRGWVEVSEKESRK